MSAESTQMRMWLVLFTGHMVHERMSEYTMRRLQPNLLQQLVSFVMAITNETMNLFKLLDGAQAYV